MRVQLFLVLLLVIFVVPAMARVKSHHVRRHACRPAVLARAAMVVDLATGRTLYAKHANQRIPIASLTKLLTAIVVLDSKRSLLKPARIANADVDRLKWSRSRLPVGSLLLRRTMLHIALMSSENRAAFALSRDYPGGRPGFVRAMNRTALRLHMTRSHFVDPTGLSPHNVSTARDLAKLARAAYHYPAIRTYSTSHQKLVLGGAGPLMYHNTDPLVHYVMWHVGLQKTGFTNEAGHCLIVMTTVRGHRMLIVLLGDPNPQAHFQDAINLRRWLVSGRHR
ncbi:peptidase S11 (plasmid) [Caballeronia sp. NK8]|uniref:D-alanyl-D-alanine carboxypeptidase family protein n=1 Tax=Caballeronia sp. NK8 TaxID=140098 RepID=UPI001BB7C5D8|nr:peptidase S11 [Caballeronia sp. NK8]BCQ28440.1 peptidase S11 [Caballeronia sp. NK8]